jgi:hypothetical protein
MRRAIALLGPVLLLACGGSRETPSRPSGLAQGFVFHACVLLTRSQAETAAEEPLRGMATFLDRQSGTDFAKCSYGTPDRLGKTVSLEVRRHADPATAARVQDSAMGSARKLAEGDLRSLAGLGDEAFWAGAKLSQLHARWGEVRLIVTVQMGPEEDRADQAESLAATAIERLKKAPTGGL